MRANLEKDGDQSAGRGVRHRSNRSEATIPEGSRGATLDERNLGEIEQIRLGSCDNDPSSILSSPARERE